jgi:hypothetical protein
MIAVPNLGWGIAAFRTAAALLLASLALPAAAESLASAYVAPAGRIQLTRTLHRPLPDGKEIVTRRRYDVEIVPSGSGYRVDGRLAGSEVEVPPSLRALAEIERNRPDDGMFPILLDGQGKITNETSPQGKQALEQAALQAASQIGGSGLPAIDMLQAQAFVRQMRGRAALSQWPADVFNPAPTHHSEQRTIPLPDGREGHATIETTASLAGEGGQLAMIERIVTTDLGGDKRLTRETWQLSQAGSETGR